MPHAPLMVCDILPHETGINSNLGHGNNTDIQPTPTNNGLTKQLQNFDYSEQLTL